MPVLLKGGHVIDPANQLDREPCDVLLDGKVVIEVGEDLQAPDEGCEVFNASGCLVCPGLVDLHVHCFPGGSVLGVDPDEWCLKRGVTTVVDAGSSGREGSKVGRAVVINYACRLAREKTGDFTAGCSDLACKKYPLLQGHSQ